MPRHSSTLAIVLTLSLLGSWSCKKEQPGQAPEAQSASQVQAAPAGSTMMQPGSGNMQPGSGNMQPGSGNMQPGSGNMMQPGAGNMQPGSGNMQPGSGNMQPGSGGTMMQELRSTCPMVVEGAKVEVTDTADGVALAFTTETGDVADLRQRVQHMAHMYGTYCQGHGQMMWHQMGGRGMHGQGMGPGGGMGMGQGRGMGAGGSPGMGQGRGMGAGGSPGMGRGRGMGARGSPGMGRMGPMPAATVKVEPLDKGARLVLTASDKSQLEALRAHVRWHEERMGSGQCWMLQQSQSAGAQKPAE